MNIHPDILVHWTDRKWVGQDLTDRLRSDYVERLFSFYQNGLWLTDQADAVEVIHGAFKKKTTIHPGAILCLTELRLSLVEKHIGRYGSLGIGFRRSFMMQKGVNPVFYLQNDDAGVVNTNLGLLHDAAQDQDKPGLQLFLSYVKAMSKEKGQDLSQYDEMEWRLVDCSVSGTGERPYPVRNGKPTFEFGPSDVEILIFPDKDTRKEAVRNDKLIPFFKSHLPMMIDATEIGNL